MGKTKTGPFKPTKISSFTDFETIFGGLSKRSTLPYSVEQYFQNGGRNAIILRQHSQEGYKELFKRIEKNKVQFNFLCIPFADSEKLDENDFFDIVIPRGLALCEKRRAIFIVDPPLSWDSLEKAVVGSKRLARQNAGALYFPRILFEDKLANKQAHFFPPSGAIAGIFARMDATKGVWKSAAGSEAHIQGAMGLQLNFTDFEHAQLNQEAINSIREFDTRFLIWGARTLGDSTSNDRWEYVPVRRLAIFLEGSIDKGTQWAVFEPNDEALWSRLRLEISAFMQDLFRQGAFQGSSPREAFFVKCDRETTTQSDVDAGIVNILVGFAPLKPAEFVVLKLRHHFKSKDDPDP